MDMPDEKTRDDFLDLLMQNQTRIYAFILSLVRNYEDADDILQNTAKTIWQKYEDSRPINNFVSWGIQIAYYKILEYRKKKTKSGIQYDNQLFETILPIVKEQQRYSDEHLEKLSNCLKKLKPRAKELIELRYYQDLKPKQISSLLGLSITNVYKIMSRIHGQLLECIGNI